MTHHAQNMEKTTRAALKPNPRWLHLLAEVLAFAGIAWAGTRHYALPDAISVIASLGVGYAIPRVTYSRIRCKNRAGAILLTIVGLLLVAWALYCLNTWTQGDGYGLRNPYLSSDDGSYYKWAVCHYDGTGRPKRLTFLGFPYMILGTFKLLGVNVVWIVAINMMMTLLAIVVTGQTATRLMAHRVKCHTPAGIATMAMLGVALLTYYLNHSVLVLKEPGLYLSISLVGYVFARMAASGKGERPWRDFALFTLACVILAGFRGNMLYFVIAGCLMMPCGGRWRENWKFASALLGISVVFVLLGNYFSTYDMAQQQNIISGNRMSRIFGIGLAHAPYSGIVGDYFNLPAWRKLLLLPVTMTVQFATPFPWVYGFRDITLSEVVCRIQLWYLVGLVALFYYLFMSWRRRETLGAWAWWPVVCFAATAYLMAGNVARYALPFQPLFAIVSTYALCRLKEEKKHRRKFVYYAAACLVIAVVGLSVAHHLQVAYVSSF